MSAYPPRLTDAERMASLEHYATEYRRLEREGLVTEPRTDTVELRRLAEAATPGPWVYDYGIETVSGLLIVCGNANEYGCLSEAADAAYIAAVNPTVVRGLLDRIEALEKALRDIVSPEIRIADSQSLGEHLADAYRVARALLEPRP